VKKIEKLDALLSTCGLFALLFPRVCLRIRKLVGISRELLTMVQGGKGFKTSSAKTGKMNRKVFTSKKCTSNKKSFKIVKPKGGSHLEHFKADQKLTKSINANIEKVMASKVIQAGERLNLNDIKSKGKAHVKEIKVGALKKKKTGIEEKMLKLKVKLDKLEGKAEHQPTKKGLLSQDVIDRA